MREELATETPSRAQGALRGRAVPAQLGGQSPEDGPPDQHEIQTQLTQQK